MKKLRIMTNNIWCCQTNQPWWEERGLDCSSAARSPKFAEIYRETLPDLIGLQEADEIFRDLIPPAIKKYGYNYGVFFAGCTPILYNRASVSPCEAHFIIYPENIPDYEGTFNNVNSKSFCVAVFKIKDTDKHIVFANTHLWWMSGDPNHGCYRPYSNEARAYQLNMLMDYIEPLREKYNCPAVIVGDLNDRYDSLPIKAAFARGYSHAHDIAVEYADERNGYHYCFPDGYDLYENPKPFKDGIDHILVKGAPEGFVRRFERYTPEHYLPLSDHFPAFIDVEI